MRIIAMNTPDQLGEVATAILTHALADPESKQLLEQLIADPDVTSRELVHTAFAIGAVATLNEVMQGHVIPLSKTAN
jgi:hypothetical protein